MYETQHPKADINRQYFRRDQGGRGLIPVEKCVQKERKSLEQYFQSSIENENATQIKKEQVIKSVTEKNEIQKEHVRQIE